MIVERKRRSVIKAISWRIIATITTMAIVFVITGKLKLTFVIGGIDIFIKMILYYLHERLWNKIYWGKIK